MAVGVDAAVLASTAVSLAIAPRLMRRTGDHESAAGRRPWARPEAFLAVVAALAYLNQVLFTVYVMRIHDGDVSSIAGGLRWVLVLFFVPALAVRYGPNVGAPIVAATAGLVICLVASACALKETLAGAGTKRIVLWAAQAVAALSVGGAAGYAAVLLVTDTYYEAGLLRGAAVCFALVVTVCALTDRWCDPVVCDTATVVRAEGDVGVRPM